MLSTDFKKAPGRLAFVSNLLPLLRERGKTQKQLAEAAGLRPERIHRMAHQRIVHTIVTRTAYRVCLVLSRWPVVKDGKRVTIRLDRLFPLSLNFRASKSKADRRS